MDKFVRNIVTNPDRLASDFVRKLSEYLIENPHGIGMFTISPLGNICISDSMYVNELDYHDNLRGLLKIKYPGEAFQRMEEYNQKYPDLTDEELNAEPVFNPENGCMEHPYLNRILERHFEEMKIQEMAIATIRTDNVREMCQKAMRYFHVGPDLDDDLFISEEDEEDYVSQTDMICDWRDSMDKFLGYQDQKTLSYLEHYDNDDWEREGLAPDYPVNPKDFDPSNDYDVKDMFYHEDMAVLMSQRWNKGSISRVIARQLCNDFYFALFMDENNEGGVTDRWWFDFSYAEPSVRVYTPTSDIVPESNEFYGYFRVKDYIQESYNSICPSRLDLEKVISLLKSLGL